MKNWTKMDYVAVFIFAMWAVFLAMGVPAP